MALNQLWHANEKNISTGGMLVESKKKKYCMCLQVGMAVVGMDICRACDSIAFTEYGLIMHRCVVNCLAHLTAKRKYAYVRVRL